MLSERELLLEERAELDAMVEKLARSPRLANLLRFIGERYLNGQTDQLREFNIATEVFGRSGAFDPGEDAIARVEAHRLRKKLTEFYDAEGKDRPIRISIPAGGYIPVFTHKEELAEPLNLPADAIRDAAPVTGADFAKPAAPTVANRRWIWNRWLWLSVAAALVLVTWFFVRGRAPRAISGVSNPNAVLASPASAGSPVLQPEGAVRLIAGYNGQPHVGPSGLTWGADRFFERGGGWRGSQQFISRTNDPFLFQTVRTGEFAYAIPLKPGTYELHLYFVEPSFGPGLGGGELSRTFNVLVNDRPVLPGFDIVSDAMGANVADERVFKEVQPASDGKLHILFEGVSGKPIISAIEVVPSAAHAQNPIRLTTQPYAYIDHAGQVWSPDNYFLNGQTSQRMPPVAGSPDPGLFATERFGHFTYAIPADLRSEYTLNLYFAEFYFGPQLLGKGGVGSRVSNVICNGTTILEQFDIFKEVGSLRADVKSFHHLKPSPQGKINLEFVPVANYPNISAIELLDESE